MEVNLHTTFKWNESKSIFGRLRRRSCVLHGRLVMHRRVPSTIALQTVVADLLDRFHWVPPDNWMVNQSVAIEKLPQLVRTGRTRFAIGVIDTKFIVYGQ